MKIIVAFTTLLLSTNGVFAQQSPQQSAYPAHSMAPVSQFQTAAPVHLKAVLPGSASPVKPDIKDRSVNGQVIFTVYLRPLYTTTIHLPAKVTSVAVGAPTLFEAEHSKDEPNLVFVKPSTHAPAESNLLVAMGNGQTVSIRLVSSGMTESPSPVPVDFVVDYASPHSLLSTVNGGPSVPIDKQSLTDVPSPTAHQQPGSVAIENFGPLDAAYQQQSDLASPVWITGHELSKQIFKDKYASSDFAVSLGKISQQEDNKMILPYSMVNVSDHWIQVLQPQVEIANPKAKKKENKKHPQALAESVPIIDMRISSPQRLAPLQRLDGALEISRPGFKLHNEIMMMAFAISSQADTPVLIPITFVAPEQEQAYGNQ